MGTQVLEYGYVGDITKFDEQPDGSLMVYGVATSPALDQDGQRCDPNWLKTAMPDWFKFANVREQHGPVAAGVGKELTHQDGDKWHLVTHVVDTNTVKKVKAGVLKGYSIGVRNGQVLRGKAAAAPNGVICGGQIAEVSLVDRPCNPDGMFDKIDLAKSEGGELLAVTPAGEVLAVIEESEDSSQPVDGAVDGELFDTGSIEWDDPFEPNDGLIESADDLDKALDLAGDDPFAAVTITKGLLESLIRGPKAGKKDADGDGRVGEGDDAKRDAEARRKARERRAAEAERERKHRGRMDAEAAQDANHAQRQGRRMEAGEHRGRLGSYAKALGYAISDAAHDLAIGAGDVDDVLELADALRKFTDNGELLMKAASAGPVVDESSAGAAIVEHAEIVKALQSVTKAQEAEIATLREQVAKVLAMPMPGGPSIHKVLSSTPALSSKASAAAEWRAKADHPMLAPEVRAAYLAKAEEVAKG